MYLMLTDFGLVVLIWLVQLIIYPGLRYYGEKDFATWHDKYTSLISVIVIPMMIIQLAFHSYMVIINPNVIYGLNFGTVIAIWAVTFFFAIPLHGNLAQNMHVTASIEKLIRINWYRTILWSQIFIIDLLIYHKFIA